MYSFALFYILVYRIHRKSLAVPSIASNRKEGWSKRPVRKNAFGIEADQRSGERRGAPIPDPLRALHSLNLLIRFKSEACSRWLSLFLSDCRAWEKSRRVSIRRVETHLCVHHRRTLNIVSFLPSSFFFCLFALKYISPVGALIYMRIPGVNRRFFGKNYHLSLSLSTVFFLSNLSQQPLLPPSFARPLTFVYSKGSGFFLLRASFSPFPSLFLSPRPRNRGRWWTNRVNRASPLIGRDSKLDARPWTKDGLPRGRRKRGEKEARPPFPSTKKRNF